MPSAHLRAQRPQSIVPHNTPSMAITPTTSMAITFTTLTFLSFATAQVVTLGGFEFFLSERRDPYPHQQHDFKRSVMKIILVLLARHFHSEKRTEESCHRRCRSLQRLLHLFEFIDQHSNRPITPCDAARRLCASESHFIPFFRIATGQSFLSHVDQFRIAKAQALIASTGKTLADVALELGRAGRES